MFLHFQLRMAHHEQQQLKKVIDHLFYITLGVTYRKPRDFKRSINTWFSV